MSGLLKYLTVTSLILATAGAVLFCVFTGASASGHETHNNMPVGQSGVITHALHAKELTLATITTTSLTSILALLLTIAFGILFFFLKLDLPLQSASINQFKRKRNDTTRIARQQIHSWLSLFEQSPNFIKPA